MTPIPETAFRTLLAGCSREEFADFIADLWRARGYEVDRDGERLLVDGRELRPVQDAGGRVAPPDDSRLVTATEPGSGSAAVVGPEDLHRMLLYAVPREQARELFESHFGRPLDDDWSDLTGGASRGWTTPGPETAVGDAAAEAGDTEPPPVVPGTVRQLLIAGIAGLPRDRGEVRGAARNPRVIAALAAVLLLAAGGWWGLFVHQPAPDSPTAIPFEVEYSEVPIDGSYRLVAQLHTTVEGETFSVTGTRTYAPGDPPVVLVRWTYGSSTGDKTVVRYGHNGSYKRLIWTNASDYRRFRDTIRENEGVVRTVAATRSVYTVDPTRVGADPDPTREFPLSVLAQLPYDRRGTTTYEGQEAVRYVPQTGWVTREYGLLDDQQTTWVQDASGEVLADPRSDAVLLADVDARILETETWGGTRTTQPTELSVRYRLQPIDGSPDAPPWVEGLDNATVRGR